MIRSERDAALLAKAPSKLRFVLLALIGPVLLLLLLLWVNNEYAESELLRKRAAASFDHRVELIELLSDLKDAETAQRGYLLTGGMVAFLQPYEPARRTVGARLASLERYPETDSGRREIAEVAHLAAAKFNEMDASIASVRRADLAGAVARVRQGSGKRVMDRLRAIVGVRIAAEERRTTAAREHLRKQREATQRVATLGGIAALALVTALLFWGWRLRRMRYEAIVAEFEAAERNQTILDSTVDAMLIINPSGSIEAINRAATRMLGYDAEALVRRDVSVVIDLAPGEGSFHQRVGLIDGDLQRRFLPDREARHQEGQLIPIDIAMGAMMVPSGAHLVVSLRDITERKRLEQLKDDLMSTVSHELRTPLTSIVGSLGLLRAGSAGALPEQAERLVGIAENSSRRLIRLINDMLDIDSMESGKLAMKREPTDLNTVITHAAQGSEGLAAAKEVTIEVRVRTEPVIVLGDSGRLLQVLTNILSNAIRFTPASGTVTVTANVSDEGLVTVAVDDQGSGVPPQFSNRIFGRFERAAGEQGLQGGAGLGLAISHEIIVRHDGRIWFEDAPGGGARFAFSLAVMRPAEMTERGSARVLICEQDAEFAGRLIAMVVKEGCAYELATSTQEARAVVARSDFDALLIDLNLPEEGGLVFARAVRDAGYSAHAPIIVVAAHALNDGEAPSPLEVIDWIDKPGDMGRLSDALRRALVRGSSDRPTVLHLDDDEDLLKVVAAALGGEARIISATTLASARTILETVSPDAAILDLRLAEGSGLDLIPFLVGSDGLAIPTIIYSAQDVSSELADQVDAVLVKARGSMPDLKATLRRVIGSREPDRKNPA